MKDPAIRRIRRVLDAIVHFLPVDKTLVFALSVEIRDTVRIAMSGNGDNYLDKAFNRTPAEVVQFIWAVLNLIATSDATSLPLHIMKLGTALMERKEAILQARFDKRSKQCELFFELTSDPEWRSKLTPKEIKFLDVAESIYSQTVTLFSRPQAERKEMYSAVLASLEKARSELNRNDVIPGRWSNLESKVTNQCE